MMPFSLVRELGRYRTVNLREFLETAEEGMTKQEEAIKDYDPNHLLDTLIKRMGLTDDGALSRKLRVATSIIHDIRHGRLPIAASMLIWINEATGISIPELRELLGDRRARCRLSYAIATRPGDIQGDGC